MEYVSYPQEARKLIWATWYVHYSGNHAGKWNFVKMEEDDMNA